MLGFEQPLLEILSILRGRDLPNLKNPRRGLSEAPNNMIQNLSKKWAANEATAAKVCEDSDQLIQVLASATLTQALFKVAFPILQAMGNRNEGHSNNEDVDERKTLEKEEGKFLLVDADSHRNLSIQRESDLTSLLGPKTLPAQGEVGSGVIDFMTQEEARSGNASRLEKGEVVETPGQLCQYHIMATCKLRLAALLSFLRTHSAQKVVVFFSTCDSVDFHALLFREAEWPLELDSPIESDGDGDGDGEGSSGGGGRGGGKTASTGKRMDMEEFISRGGAPGDAHAKNVSNYLDPLELRSVGIFGKDCPMFRLHGNVPHKVRKEGK